MSVGSTKKLLVVSSRQDVIAAAARAAQSCGLSTCAVASPPDSLDSAEADLAVIDCTATPADHPAWASIQNVARRIPALLLIADEAEAEPVNPSPACGAGTGLALPETDAHAYLPWPAGSKLLHPAVRSLIKNLAQVQELSQSEELFRSVAEDASAGIGSLDFSGKWLWANRRLCRIFGFDGAQLLQTSCSDVVSSDSTALFQEQIQKILDGRCDKVALELSCKNRSGASFWASWHLSTVRTSHGKPVCIVAVVEDISVRLWTRANLLKIRTAVEASSDGIAIADPECRFTFHNRAFERLFGYSAEDLSKPGAHLKLYADTSVANRVLQTVRAGTPWHGEVEMLTASGEKFPVELQADGIFDEQGVFIGFVGVHTNISGRKASDRRIRQLSRAVEQTGSIVAITDAKGTLEYVNPKFEEITGYSAKEALGKNPNILKSGFLGSEAYADLWKTISDGRTWRGEFLNKKKSGELFWEYATISPVLDESGVITHFIAVKENITERKQLESRLLQAQKMQAIGQLAGRVAHDFNNMLAVIRGHAELLRLNSETFPAGLQESTNQIMRACDSAANLARQLLIFSRRRDIEPQQFLINDLVNRLAVMLRRLLSDNIQLECSLSATVPLIEADPVMLEQLIMNLFVNARDAIVAQGKVRISTDYVTLTQPLHHNHPDARPGLFVTLSVEDNGTGIAPEVLPRIFEPFFTTKKSSKGTGLGLATVYTVVKQHSGWVEVQSTPNKGTIFTAYLPVLQPSKDSEADRAPMLSQGHEVILLVETNSHNNGKTRQNLEMLGYKVLPAIDAGQAIDLWENHRQEISLLLTELVLADNIRGVDIANHMRLDRPELRIVLMSHSDPAVAESELAGLKGTGAQRTLQLPFSLKTLSKVVRDCLQQPLPIDTALNQFKP